MLSLIGKLNHYQWLVPEGPWQKGFLLQLQDARAPSSDEFDVSDLARVQAAWWIVHLQAARDHFSIPDLRTMSSIRATVVFSDAGGGSENKIKNGIGGVIFPKIWYYLPWPALVRQNRENSLGVKFAFKLSTLEGFGALVGLATVPDLVRNAEVVMMNDNSGFVDAFRKKHSSCPYLYTVSKAVADLSRGLNCQVRVLKTKRCSGEGERAADALSKGEWHQAWTLIPDKNPEPAFIPRTLIKWISNPVPDLQLGQKVLEEMSKYTAVLH